MTRTLTSSWAPFNRVGHLNLSSDSYSTLVRRSGTILLGSSPSDQVWHMKRLLASHVGIVGTYVAFVATVSLIARWQLGIS